MSALTKSGESQSHSEQIRQFMVSLYALISRKQFRSSPAGTSRYRIKILGTDVSTDGVEVNDEYSEKTNVHCIHMLGMLFRWDERANMTYYVRNNTYLNW